MEFCTSPLTVHASSVVSVRSGKAGRGVDVQVDLLSQLYQGDVVRVFKRDVVTLVDDRVHGQADNFPDDGQVWLLYLPERLENFVCLEGGRQRDPAPPPNY